MARYRGVLARLRAGVALVFTGPAIEARMVPRLQFPVGVRAAPDVRGVLFTAATALLTVLLFGLVPALRAPRLDPSAALRDW